MGVLADKLKQAADSAVELVNQAKDSGVLDEVAERVETAAEKAKAKFKGLGGL